MVHRDGYGFALDGVLRYQEEELLPPLTHQFLFFCLFFFFISCSWLSLSLPILSLFLLLLLSFLFPLFLFFSLYISLIIASYRSEQEKGMDGWDQIRALAKKVFVFWMSFWCCIGFSRSCISFLHVFNRFFLT